MVIIVKISLKHCDKYDPSKYTCIGILQNIIILCIFREFDACDNSNLVSKRD